MRTSTAVIIGTVLIVLISCFYVVGSLERAVVVRFNEVVEGNKPPGVFVKIPIFDKVYTYPIKVENFAAIEGPNIEAGVIWQVCKPLAYYRELGAYNFDSANQLVKERLQTIPDTSNPSHAQAYRQLVEEFSARYGICIKDA